MNKQEEKPNGKYPFLIIFGLLLGIIGLMIALTLRQNNIEKNLQYVKETLQQSTYPSQDKKASIQETNDIHIDNFQNKDFVRIDDKEQVTIYYPLYSKIDLICGEMPSKSDNNVILTCAAAYTVKCLDTFDHKNIIGNHISNGVFFNGAPSKSYKGAFTFYDGKPHFAYDNWAEDFNNARTDGCGFAQDMMIHNGELVKSWRNYNSKTIFRALCLLNNRIAVIDSKKDITFGKFIYELANLGVQEAIYLDMGNWKHSWYRDADGKAIDIFPNPTKYGTNWITFYR